MRHKKGDMLYVTDGEGSIYRSVIIEIKKHAVQLEPISKSFKINNAEGIIFFLSIIKSNDRLESAVEKCVELGITEFILFPSEKSEKKNVKMERMEKIVLAAMKQSLRSHKPKISYLPSLKKAEVKDRNWVIFDQLADKKITDHLREGRDINKANFLFGPEGGLTDSDLEGLSPKIMVKLSDHRLRSETAAIAAASLLASHLG
jgi:16S rRNA (uracil1498-N3)-methyltransferase